MKSKQQNLIATICANTSTWNYSWQPLLHVWFSQVLFRVFGESFQSQLSIYAPLPACWIVCALFFEGIYSITCNFPFLHRTLSFFRYVLSSNARAERKNRKSKRKRPTTCMNKNLLKPLIPTELSFYCFEWSLMNDVSVSLTSNEHQICRWVIFVCSENSSTFFFNCALIFTFIHFKA